MNKPSIRILKLKNYPIFEQLQIEEALLRLDSGNWCIINEGSAPAIVLGISGKPELLVDEELLKTHPLPMIKRFTGGGTVVVDPSTFFVTFIGNSIELKVPCTPKDIFLWSERMYRPVFNEMGFKLVESDYVIGNKKFGGNAQYIRKDRWLHHTSFLWDYNPELMKYLKMPSKKPDYRGNRLHDEFLCRLKDYMKSQEDLEQRLADGIMDKFSIFQANLEEAKSFIMLPHRKATVFL